MRILNIGPGEALASVAQKCNSNFKTLSYELTQLMRKMGRDEHAAIEEDLDQRIDHLITQDIPDEVASQIITLDVPGMVSGEVSSQLADADIPGMVDQAISDEDIPSMVSEAVSDAGLETMVADEVADQIGTAYTTTVADFITADEDVVITGGVARRWGKVASITLSYRLASSYSVLSDGKMYNIHLGTLTQDWMTAGGMTNLVLDATYQVMGIMDNNGLIAFMSANSRGSSYTIDQNAILYAGFTYLLA